jgi:hypothetical protein
MTTEIRFSIEPTDKSIPLGFEVRLDNVVYFDTTHVDQLQSISIPLNDDVDAEHSLELVLKNKLPEHTQLSDSGEIISDAVIKITDVLFDQILLSSVFSAHARYTHDFNGTQSPVEDKFFECMGCNGTVSLKFTTPIYQWLLENM